MKLYHHSQKEEYRCPHGAVPTGSRVRLGLKTEGETPTAVDLRLFRPTGEETLAMDREEEGFYTVLVEVGETPCLLWYDFVVTTQGGTFYYCNQRDGLGGEGRMTDAPAANSYQITVYDASYRVPEWFFGKMMYQIFPDRFCRGRGVDLPPERQSTATLHHNWHEEIFFTPHPYENGPACNDFYGGDLEGIRQKLPYLASLGVEVLYLNPVFAAYSNHRYDTADYRRIDPILGTEEDFCRLCQEAKEEYGIRVILDGVFSHTGADSVYFNKYGTYGEGAGAYRDPNSPYREWYQFNDYPAYQSWWGCSNLPNVNEMTPSYLAEMLEKDDAVIKKWIRCGASGWRLDVADELPDEFIKILRRELKKTDKEAVLIGEVWEDASNKRAYDSLREYLWGHELDSVMNYPFRNGVLGFLQGSLAGEDFARQMESQRENYPKDTLHCLMNMLGTHDTMRVKSLLGGMGENCGREKLDSFAEELATKRVMLGIFLQMTFDGVPCIYYGDEVGMEGGKDPYNRQTYPWRKVDPDLRAWVARLGQMRKKSPLLQRGDFTTLYARGGVYLYLRTDGEGNVVLCAVNRDEEAREVPLSLSKDLPFPLREVLGEDGEEVTAETEGLTLPPLSARLYWNQ